MKRSGEKPIPKNIDRLQEVRRVNFRKLINESTGVTALARRLKKTKGWVGQLQSGHRPITEKTASIIESSLAKPEGWLSKDQTGMTESSRQIVIADIDSAFDAVRAELKAEGVTATIEQIMQMVKLVHREAQITEKIDPQLIKGLIKLLKPGDEGDGA